jgi:hypothetical protein
MCPNDLSDGLNGRAEGEIVNGEWRIGWQRATTAWLAEFNGRAADQAVRPEDLPGWLSIHTSQFATLTIANSQFTISSTRCRS